MLQLKKDENVFVTGIKKAREAGKKVYVLGAAYGGVRIVRGLQYRGLDADAFAVDREYYREGAKALDKDILCIEDVDPDSCVLIRSIADYSKRDELNRKFDVIDEDVQSLSMVASNPFDQAFIQAQHNEFEEIYDALSDERSRQVMTAYLNQKLTGRFCEMADAWNILQYFDGNFYDLAKVDCIVDCGAFIGDSFQSFCDEYHRRAGRKFSGKAFLLDPDEGNQEKIRKSFPNIAADVKGLQMGAWSETGTLSFQTDGNFGNAGKIADTGDISIRVDTIDHILGENRVDFIKMDIEGSELNALHGAQKAIKRDHPVLAICAYHKREDLLELPAYIRSLYPGYQFYLRAYGGPYSIELVLYAVA